MHNRIGTFLGSKKFKREIGLTFTLALPLMLGELSSMLMGVAGTMMSGRLGETALAASGVAGVVFVIAMLFVWGSVRMIPTPIAEAHELRDGVRVRTLIGAGLVMGLILTVVGCVLLYVGVQNFHVLNQHPDVERLAVEYLLVVVFSVPILVLFAVLVNYADAFSYVKLTMYLSFLGLAIDVALNWLFIFGHWGFPAMGIKAIAMNTGITHLIMVAGLSRALWTKAELAYFRQARTTWVAVWKQTLSFLRYGIPSAMQMMVEFAAFGAGTILIGQISKTEQAANQVALNLVSVTYVTILAISTAGMIRVGQAMAYKSRVRVWMAGMATLALAVMIIMIPTVFFLSIPGSITALYVQDPAVITVATSLVVLGGFFQLFDAVQACSISLLRAINDTRMPALISFVAFWLIGLPLGYWLAKEQGWNARGIWTGYLVALILQAGWFVLRFLGLVKIGRFLRLENETLS